MWDGRNEDHGFSPIVLPDGRRFSVVRDAKKPTEFLGVVFDPAKGTVTEITGSRAANISGINNVYANYKGLPIFNSTKYPNVVALFRDNDATCSGVRWTFRSVRGGGGSSTSLIVPPGQTTRSRWSSAISDSP